MKKYTRLSADERWRVIKPIIEGKSSYSAVEKSENIERSKLRGWVRKYKHDGFPGLENGKGWKQYTKELKQQAVEDVLVKGMSQRSVAEKYNISDASVLRRWIKRYNSGKELEATSAGRVGTIMTK